ncbi:hypothetical protein ACFZBC_03140 [Streptomyces luteogriseus]|uniref:hypothetical protein n=1 Tax=Streptomyces luteogriseus TaxID=68233 RepID=UPI0036E30EF3
MTTQTAVAAEEAPAPRAAGSTEGATAVSGGAAGADRPAADGGRTSIAGLVVVRVAGITARETPGVHDVGGGPSRTRCAATAEAEESAAQYGPHTRGRVSAASHRAPHVR